MKNPILWIVAVVLLLGGLLYWSSRFGSNTAATTELRPGEWTVGAENPKVSLIEYSDFQCPACATYEPLLQQLRADFKDTLSFTYRHFPLVQIHPSAIPSALAAEAAGKQGKFWEMHDLLFIKQSEWSVEADPNPFFTLYAKELKLNETRFAADMKDAALRQKIDDSLQEAIRLGLNSTPTFFVNGVQIAPPRSYEAFKELLESAMTATSSSAR